LHRSLGTTFFQKEVLHARFEITNSQRSVYEAQRTAHQYMGCSSVRIYRLIGDTYEFAWTDNPLFLH